MPQELPGFYYDEERNRYFPIKGPIPGSSFSLSNSKASSSSSSSSSVAIIQRLPNLASRVSLLLRERELDGDPLSLKHGKCKFQDEFLKIRASCPQVWRFPGMERLADRALEQTRIDVVTPEGQTGTIGLLTGGISGSLSFCEVGKVGQRFDYGVKCMPDRVRPVTRENDECCKSLAHLWRPLETTIQLSSDVSCIKLLGERNPTMLNANHALVTTLGSERSGGSIHILNLAEPFDFNARTSRMRQRLRDVASFNCTVWTADCNSNGKQAVVGTNKGAALLDLESGVVSWVCHCRSDVLAQQFDQTGKIILCGLRNGAIVTVDVRERQGASSSRLTRHQIPAFPSGSDASHSSKRWFKLFGKIYPAHTTYMPKSIVSLVSLQLYDQYFLASSMDGSIHLYDHRLIKGGPVQCYEGQVNSHTRIQLGTDPSERFVLSGGEDCYLRLWSIKSGKLLFQDKFSTSVPSAMCCWSCEGYPMEESSRQNCFEYFDEQSDGWGSWVGSRDGLYYMQWA